MVRPRPIGLLALLVVLILTACSESAESPLSTQEQDGQRLFLQHCASCHATAGETVIVGPSLAGVSSRAESRVADMDARAYLEQSILQPSAYLNPGYNDLMPRTFGQMLTSEDLDALISYLFTLK